MTKSMNQGTTVRIVQQISKLSPWCATTQPKLFLTGFLTEIEILLLNMYDITILQILLRSCISLNHPGCNFAF